MQPETRAYSPAPPDTVMKVCVMGPDAPGPSLEDLRRLFRGHRLSPVRRARLIDCGRVVAHCEGRIVGLAVYQRLEVEVRVYEFGVDEQVPCGVEAVVARLLDALEVACLAGGCRRLVVVPHGQVEDRFFTERGFAALAHGSATHLFEKRFQV